jgi:hypothetical protein
MLDKQTVLETLTGYAIANEWIEHERIERLKRIHWRKHGPRLRIWWLPTAYIQFSNSRPNHLGSSDKPWDKLLNNSAGYTNFPLFSSAFAMLYFLPDKHNKSKVWEVGLQCDR